MLAMHFSKTKPQICCNFTFHYVATCLELQFYRNTFCAGKQENIWRANYRKEQQPQHKSPICISEGLRLKHHGPSLKNILCFHAWKCWNAVLDSSYRLGSLLTICNYTPYFPTWKSAHTHVMWKSQDTYCRNVDMFNVTHANFNVSVLSEGQI